MGRRKIEIKAIKDERNRSVTFLKRKGGLFKKAHELSVLCSVDVAVFIFGNNKKLYEYSSADMRDLITRYQYHGGPNEHKGPTDFSGGNDDDDDEDGEGTPPLGAEHMDNHQSQMMPPQYHQQSFPQVRHHTPSASPPVHNGTTFPGPHMQRGHTPQPQMGSRPTSRNDMRRSSSGLVAHHGQHPSMPYMSTPPVYNHSNLVSQHTPQYPAYPQQHQQYIDDRRSSSTPGYPSHPQPMAGRASTTPPQPQAAQIPNPIPHISPPPPPPPPPPSMQEPPAAPPAPMEPKMEAPPDIPERPRPTLLNTDSAIKKARKTHSIFTPIEENRSVLAQHLASFTSDPPGSKLEGSNLAIGSRKGSRGSNGSASYSQDSNSGNATGPPRNGSAGSTADAAFKPPSRSNSLKAAASATRPRGPRLTVQIPDDASEKGSANNSSHSPRPPDSLTPNHAGRVVLPPPSPSASALLSAGASGPPNPFARPPPQQNVNGEATPASALPSRFLSDNLFPSPSQFYHDWGFNRGGDSNTLPSPLNFATPVVGSGPSFLRDDNHPVSGSGGPAGGPGKRKSTEFSEGSDEAKRVKVSD